MAVPIAAVHSHVSFPLGIEILLAAFTLTTTYTAWARRTGRKVFRTAAPGYGSFKLARGSAASALAAWSLTLAIPCVYLGANAKSTAIKAPLSILATLLLASCIAFFVLMQRLIARGSPRWLLPPIFRGTNGTGPQLQG